MATTEIDICSRALMLLGADPISSLLDETDNARLLASVYPALRRSYLSKYPWRFVMGRAELTRETAAPAGGGWEYSFILPPDRLTSGAFAAFSSDGSFASPFADWQIVGNRLHGNVERVWVEYSRNLGESVFPEYFIEFLVAALCASVAFSVTDQQNSVAHWDRLAFGTDGAGGLLLEAQIADSQQHPSAQVRGDYDLIIARFG